MGIIYNKIKTNRIKTGRVTYEWNLSHTFSLIVYVVFWSSTCNFMVWVSNINSNIFRFSESEKWREWNRWVNFRREPRTQCNSEKMNFIWENNRMDFVFSFSLLSTAVVYTSKDYGSCVWFLLVVAVYLKSWWTFYEN